jgi:transcription elongation factor GreA
MVVSVHFDGDATDEETFLLGSREIAATTDMTVYSPESAMGEAILGHGKGDTVSYRTPTGSTIQVTIDDLSVFPG